MKKKLTLSQRTIRVLSECVCLCWHGSQDPTCKNPRTRHGLLVRSAARLMAKKLKERGFAVLLTD
jgi:hypothetical protein